MSKLIIEPLDFQIDPSVLVEGFTQSEMGLWDNCSEAWYLRYCLKLEKKGSWNWGGVVGSWIHSYLEEFIMSKGRIKNWNPILSKAKLKGIIQNAQWLADFEYWKLIGGIMMELYTSYYKHDFECYQTLDLGVEHIVDFHYEGYRLKGMIDWPAYSKKEKKNLIIDHKTTGRLDKSILLGWDFRFQFMFYMWLMHKTEPKLKFGGFMPNGIKKPQQRFNPQKESLITFGERVRTEILKEPEKFFYRDVGLLKLGDMKHFEEQILKPKLSRIRLLFDPKVSKDVKMAIIRNKNTDYCVKYGASYPCQFLDICQRGFKLSLPQFQKRDVKHTELAEEAE